MVYQQKLIAVIKHNGKILRERDKDTVYLPFHAEYEIFIKNLESRDCVISISIDGEDVLDKQRIIVRANSSTSLEGFLKNDKVTNKFKFIQKTKQIQDHRGDKIDDGLIRIEYQFVKVDQTITTTYHHNHVHWYHPWWCQCPSCHPHKYRPHWPDVLPVVYYGDTRDIYGSIPHTELEESIYNCSVGGNSASNISTPLRSVGNSVTSKAFMPQMDEGITVKGSESNQQFNESYVSPLEDQSYTIIIKLRGVTKDDQPVEKPILVSTKLNCPTCGHHSKSNMKYCPNCGTALF
jgi:hypothetical protein